jgi:hypothetical protein
VEFKLLETRLKTQGVHVEALRVFMVKLSQAEAFEQRLSTQQGAGTAPPDD